MSHDLRRNELASIESHPGVTWVQGLVPLQAPRGPFQPLVQRPDLPPTHYKSTLRLAGSVPNHSPQALWKQFEGKSTTPRQERAFVSRLETLDLITVGEYFGQGQGRPRTICTPLTTCFWGLANVPERWVGRGRRAREEILHLALPVLALK